jgi:hypothetical protein
MTNPSNTLLESDATKLLDGNRIGRDMKPQFRWNATQAHLLVPASVS